MFKNSNYLQIWNQLTSYYDKVSINDKFKLKVNFFIQENILVVDGDKFIEAPVPVLQSVEKFLNIPPFYKDQHFTFNGDSP